MFTFIAHDLGSHRTNKQDLKMKRLCVHVYIDALVGILGMQATKCPELNPMEHVWVFMKCQLYCNSMREPLYLDGSLCSYYYQGVRVI